LYRDGQGGGFDRGGFTGPGGLYRDGPGGGFDRGGFTGPGDLYRDGQGGGFEHSGFAGPGGFGGFGPASAGALAVEALLKQPPDFAPLPGRARGLRDGTALRDSAVAEARPPAYGEIRYAGRVFGLFILIEKGDKLYIIDQHAAHERILYDRFLSRPIPKQDLLVPIPFSAGSDEEDRFLESRREDLGRLGIVLNRDGTDWFIEALPLDWRLGDAETVKEILSLREAGENMAERWAATLCCHSAVRDGDYLDDEAALTMAEEALELPDPHCPHGRPVWTEISREALYRAVRRI
jgi:DNA mismatch repair protein MutL